MWRRISPKKGSTSPYEERQCQEVGYCKLNEESAKDRLSKLASGTNWGEAELGEESKWSELDKAYETGTRIAYGLRLKDYIFSRSQLESQVSSN